MTETPSGSGLSDQSGHPDQATTQECLVERIYEASHRPELWPGVLEQIGQFIDAPLGFVIFGDPDAAQWRSTPGFDGVIERMIQERWLTRGTYLRKLFQLCASGFCADQDVMAFEELRDEPVFRDFWFPSGIGFGATTSLELPTGERVTIGWRRRLRPRRSARTRSDGSIRCGRRWPARCGFGRSRSGAACAPWWTRWRRWGCPR